MMKKQLRNLFTLLLVLILGGCSVSFKTNKDNVISNKKDLDVATVVDTKSELNTETTIIEATTTEEKITVDSDGDGLTDAQELEYKTDSFKQDSDEDGFNDGDEVKKGYNPAGAGKLVVSVPIGVLNTVEFCANQSETENMKRTCFINLAIDKKDSALCKNLAERTLVIDCMIRAEVAIGNTKPCEIIKIYYPDVYDECVVNLQNNTAALIENRNKLIISDIRQIQTALELYYNDIGKYPLEIKTGSPISNDVTTYLSAVPASKAGLTSACKTDYEYKYKLINPKEYSLVYCLDSEIKVFGYIIKAGSNIATPNGIASYK